MSKRGEEWQKFSTLVLDHIENYTVPQYGDKGADQATGFSPEDCIREIDKYKNRHFTGVRGKEETLRDLFKVAHYACICHAKEDVNT